MAADVFSEEDFRVLTPEAFGFVFENELKRAARSQNFLTLVTLQPALRDAPEGGSGDRDQTVREIARLISRELRETDLLSQTGVGQLSIVLLDADFQSAMRVIDRVMARLEHYEFARPLTLEVGAACCPTHGADADSLRRAAEARAARPRRDSRGTASNQ